MKHTDTQAYADLVTQLGHLEAVRAGLAGTRLSSQFLKTHRSIFNQGIDDLRTWLNRIERLEALAPETLFVLLTEALGTAWTREERELNELPRADYEGQWEKSVRHRLGLPLAPTQSDCDLPDGSEIKHLSSWQFRSGKHGARHYVDAIKAARAMSIDVSCFEHGELSEGLIVSLPAPTREFITDALLASKVLARHPTLYLCNDDGHIIVPLADYDRALRFQRTSQGKPRYRLQAGYLVDRLRALT